MTIDHDYSTMIHLMKYAKPMPGGGRETWRDSVDRLFRYISSRELPPEVRRELSTSVYPLVLAKKVMPSMRLLSSAGPACERENLAAFNCMFLGIDSIESFGRLMYALMCGTGVGFSVEHMYLDKLPSLSCTRSYTGDTLIVEDSRLSWAKVTIEYMSLLRCGHIVDIDYSLIRPKGAPLKVTGGYASGPEPLIELHKFIREVMLSNTTERLSSLEVYDICCKIADVVVQGGVRRSACICLFDGADDLMFFSKTPNEIERNPWRSNANNSAAFQDSKDAEQRFEEVLELARITGDPGCVIKSALQGRMAKSLRLPKEDIGVNP